MVKPVKVVQRKNTMEGVEKKEDLKGKEKDGVKIGDIDMNILIMVMVDEVGGMSQVMRMMGSSSTMDTSVTTMTATIRDSGKGEEMVITVEEETTRGITIIGTREVPVDITGMEDIINIVETDITKMVGVLLRNIMGAEEVMTTIAILTEIVVKIGQIPIIVGEEKIYHMQALTTILHK